MAIERAGRVRTGRFGRSRTAPEISFSREFSLSTLIDRREKVESYRQHFEPIETPLET